MGEMGAGRGRAVILGESEKTHTPPAMDKSSLTDAVKCAIALRAAWRLTVRVQDRQWKS